MNVSLVKVMRFGFVIVTFWTGLQTRLIFGVKTVQSTQFEGGLFLFNSFCRLSWLTNSALISEPKYRWGGGGGCGILSYE
jgi:hypothetical protein